MAVLVCTGMVQVGQSQVATNVTVYTFPYSLPDVTQVDFGTVRDYIQAQMQVAKVTSTQSRVNRTTGIEIRRSFEVGDMVVSVNPIWRGIFGDSAYPGQTGNRLYCGLTVVGNGGMISLSMIGYAVTCQRVPSLGNSSSLNGTDYSTSRRGVRRGADGKLWTVDDEVITSGSGTNLVDAVVFIGARIGALVSNQNDINYLNGQVTTNGTPVDFEYQYNSPTGILKSKSTVMLYPQGGIPFNTNRFELFDTPVGRFFSVVQVKGSAPFDLKSSREVNGPYTYANPANSAATEGSSAFLEYVGDSSTNRMFVKPTPIVTVNLLKFSGLFVALPSVKGNPNQTLGEMSSTGVVVSAPSDDLAQDK